MPEKLVHGWNVGGMWKIQYEYGSWLIVHCLQIALHCDLFTSDVMFSFTLPSSKSQFNKSKLMIID